MARVESTHSKVIADRELVESAAGEEVEAEQVPHRADHNHDRRRERFQLKSVKSNHEPVVKISPRNDAGTKKHE